jgi:Tol biopolymer transport system component
MTRNTLMSLSARARSFQAVALLLIFATPSLAQQGVAGPKWSRDGNFITFAAIEGGTDFEIFVIRSNGTGVRQLTRNDFTDISPSFSNDGSTIYFAAAQDRGEHQLNDRDIAKISPDGGAIEHVFGNPGFSEGHPAELPDGRIAYTRRPVGEPYDPDLRVWDPETEKSSYLIEESPIESKQGLWEINVTAPSSGDWFLFSSKRNGHFEVFSASLDGRDIEQLTASFRKDPDNWLGNAAPSVSADGRYFVVWTDQPAPKATGDPEGYIVHSLYDRETGQSRYLPKQDIHRFMAFPGLSPDGSKVTFAATINVGGPAGPWGLFVQDVATGDVREVWRQSLDDE